MPPIKKVGICVGHSKRGDKGARSVGGAYEHPYNTIVAQHLQEKLKDRGIASIILNESPFGSYTKTMKWLGEQTWGCDIAIELHYNSYSSTKANGFEYLYHHASKEGKRLAESFLFIHEDVLPGQVSRGIKPINYGGRGFGFLSKTKPPAIICEPFFGSNPKEWVLFADNEKELAQIYCDAIARYFGVD